MRFFSFFLFFSFSAFKYPLNGRLEKKPKSALCAMGVFKTQWPALSAGSGRSFRKSSIKNTGTRAPGLCCCIALEAYFYPEGIDTNLPTSVDRPLNCVRRDHPCVCRQALYYITHNISGEILLNSQACDRRSALCASETSRGDSGLVRLLLIRLQKNTSRRSLLCLHKPGKVE